MARTPRFWGRRGQEAWTLRFSIRRPGPPESWVLGKGQDLDSSVFEGSILDLANKQTKTEFPVKFELHINDKNFIR